MIHIGLQLVAPKEWLPLYHLCWFAPSHLIVGMLGALFCVWFPSCVSTIDWSRIDSCSESIVNDNQPCLQDFVLLASSRWRSVTGCTTTEQASSPSHVTFAAPTRFPPDSQSPTMASTGRTLKREENPLYESGRGMQADDTETMSFNVLYDTHDSRVHLPATGSQSYTVSGVKSDKAANGRIPFLAMMVSVVSLVIAVVAIALAALQPSCSCSTESGRHIACRLLLDGWVQLRDGFQVSQQHPITVHWTCQTKCLKLRLPDILPPCHIPLVAGMMIWWFVHSVLVMNSRLCVSFAMYNGLDGEHLFDKVNVCCWETPRRLPVTLEQLQSNGTLYGHFLFLGHYVDSTCLLVL